MTGPGDPPLATPSWASAQADKAQTGRKGTMMHYLLLAIALLGILSLLLRR